MPYIGNPPAERFTSFAYQDLTGGSGTSFTLNNAVGNPQEIEVFVNNVRQEPGVAYTVSGTGLTMTGSIASTDDFYVVFQGKAIQTATHPSDRALTATDGTFTGDLTVDTNTLKVDATNNRVGVGTASPSTPFETSGAGTIARLTGTGTNVYLGLGNSSDSGGYLAYDGTDVQIWSESTKRITVDSDGLKFGSDTAAANALDDYEEGTWTGTLTGASSNPSSTITATGYYTKIGRQVNIAIDFNNSDNSGASGTVVITGIPFSPGTGADGPGSGNVGTYYYNIHSANNLSVQVHSSGIYVYGSRDQNTWAAMTHLPGSARYLSLTASYFV